MIMRSPVTLVKYNNYLNRESNRGRIKTMYKSKKRLQNSKLFTRNRIDIYMGDIQSLRYWGITCDFAGPLTQF